MLKPEPSNEPRPLIGRNGWVPLSTLILVAAAILFLTIAGKLWAAPSQYRPAGPPMHGELRIVGSHAAAQPIQRWVEIFRREHPDVRTTIMLYGAGTAADAMAEGEADVAPLVRPLKDDERALVVHAGGMPSPVTVALSTRATRPNQPLYLYVNRDTANSVAAEFVRVALSEEGQAVLTGGYVPVPRDMRRGAIALIGGNKSATTIEWRDLQGED